MTNTKSEVDDFYKKWRAEAELNKNKAAKLQAEVNTHTEMQTNPRTNEGRYFKRWSMFNFFTSLFWCLLEKKEKNK